MAVEFRLYGVNALKVRLKRGAAMFESGIIECFQLFCEDRENASILLSLRETSLCPFLDCGSMLLNRMTRVAPLNSIVNDVGYKPDNKFDNLYKIELDK